MVDFNARVHDERRAALRDQFTKARGRWVAALDDVLAVDPEFFEAYLEFAAAPWRSGTLDPKLRELIYIAVNASTTKLYEPGLRHHIAAALDQGATKEEILEVLELISVLGMHTMTMGVPVLLEELDARGIDAGAKSAASQPLDERRQALKDQFTRERGKWAPLLEAMLLLDPDFFQAYLELAAAPWRSGTLPPKFRELIYVAIDANTTHLYEPGFRHHLRAALDQGATKEEILEVLELITDIGIHAVAMGVPVLIEELKARGST